MCSYNGLFFFTKGNLTFKGTAIVQVQRNIHPQLYINGPPPPLTEQFFDVSHGEDSILCQYKQAISSAQRFICMMLFCNIYVSNLVLDIENQHFAHNEILELLIAAANRGVRVIAVVPSRYGKYSWIYEFIC